MLLYPMPTRSARICPPPRVARTCPTLARSITTQAQLDAVERLKDQVAYRDTARLLMRERMLDDVHDSDGRVLYELNFGLTMLPAQAQKEHGVLAFEITKVTAATFGEKQRREAYDAARKAAEHEAIAYANYLQERARQGTLPSTLANQLLAKIEPMVNTLETAERLRHRNRPTRNRGQERWRQRVRCVHQRCAESTTPTQVAARSTVLPERHRALARRVQERSDHAAPLQ